MELSDFTPSHENPKTDDTMALMEARQKADDGNFLRSLAETVLQILMEADVEGLIAAGCYPPLSAYLSCHCCDCPLYHCASLWLRSQDALLAL